MKIIFYTLGSIYFLGLSSLTIKNYLDLKKIKKDSLKESKIIDYTLWGDFYD